MLVTLPPRNGSQCRKNEGRSCWRISKTPRDPHPPPSKLECRARGWRKQEGAIWLGLKHHYSAPLSWTGSLAHVTLPTGPASSHFWPWFPTWLDEPLYFPSDALVETGTITYHHTIIEAGKGPSSGLSMGWLLFTASGLTSRIF